MSGIHWWKKEVTLRRRPRGTVVVAKPVFAVRPGRARRGRVRAGRDRVRAAAISPSSRSVRADEPSRRRRRPRRCRSVAAGAWSEQRPGRPRSELGAASGRPTRRTVRSGLARSCSCQVDGADPASSASRRSCTGPRRRSAAGAAARARCRPGSRTSRRSFRRARLDTLPEAEPEPEPAPAPPPAALEQAAKKPLLKRELHLPRRKTRREGHREGRTRSKLPEARLPKAAGRRSSVRSRASGSAT